MVAIYTLEINSKIKNIYCYAKADDLYQTY
jgi:hypothetical protein